MSSLFSWQAFFFSLGTTIIRLKNEPGDGKLHPQNTYIYSELVGVFFLS